MAKYIALMRGYIPADATPVKRPEMTGERRVMRIVEKGEVFNFEGKPGKWMQRYTEDSGQTEAGKPGGRKPKSTKGESGQTQVDTSQASQEQGNQHGDGSP